jgi:segregation and condensation protein B
MTPQEIQAALEAIIYAADEPATLDQIAKALGVEKVEARAALDLLVANYQTDDRGIEVRKVAGGWKSLQPPLRLTMPALETLAVIAYKQPATIPEINEIRGVNVGGVIKTLLEKRLITTAGRKEVIGRPILYRTSKQFLMRFGLFDLDELPSLKEFEALAQAALGDDTGIAPTEPEDSSVAAAASSEPPAGAEASTGAVPDDPIEADVVAASAQISDKNADIAENPSGEADNVRAAAASGGKGPSDPGS